MKPWLVTFLRRLFGWTENGCKRTSPSAEPRLQYPISTVEARAAFMTFSTAQAHIYIGMVVGTVIETICPRSNINEVENPYIIR